MPFSPNDVLLGLLIPALAALLLTLGVTRLAQGAWLTRVMPLALATGFLAGYLLLKLGPIVPKYDRTWIPYAVLLSLAPAMLPGRHRLTFAVKALVAVAVCFFAAWLLVPNWEAIKDSRTLNIARWGVYAAIVTIALMLVARRDVLSEASGPFDPSDGAAGRTNSWPLLFIGSMIASLGCAFILLALSGSLRFAHMAAAGLAALAGVAVTLWFSKQRPALDSLAIVYSMLITSVLLTGWVNSFSGIPLTSYLLLPAVPLAQWTAAPSSDPKPLTFRQRSVSIGIAAAICLVSLGMAVFMPRE